MIDLRSAIDLLARHRVDYVLIGGAAMAAHGSGYVTQDIDLAYDRTDANIERLALALSEIGSKLRVAREQPLSVVVDARFLKNGMNFTFTTAIGDLDVLGHVPGFKNYADVAAYSEEGTLFGSRVRILSLEGLLIAKRAAGRPKDMVAIQEIESLIEWRKSEDGK